MKITSISFTRNGDALNLRLSELLKNDLFTRYGTSAPLRKRETSLAEWTRYAFYASDALIFIGAAGIAVRAVAPYIKSKATDPAVIVIDERGEFVIPILSGHIGGGNETARKIAGFLGARAVITTATDINGIWAVDIWAKKNGCVAANPENIKYISSALLRNERVGLESDFEIRSALPENVILGGSCKNGIVISLDENKKPFEKTLNIVPKILHIGVGSRKNADKDSLTELYKKIKSEYKFSDKAVKSVSTIDIKKGEASVDSLCAELGIKAVFFGAERLNEAEGTFCASEFVKRTAGTDCVCERAAALNGGRLIVRKTIGNGVTMAVGKEDWSVDFENSGSERQ